MEFIPLETYSEGKETKPNQTRKSVKKRNDGINKKLKKKEVNEKVLVKKTKSKPPGKVLQKKSVKNKYKEVLDLKKKKRIELKKVRKEKEDTETNPSKNEEDEDEEEANDEEEQQDEEEQECEMDDEEKALRKKCKQMDEKKKNRLFIKLKDKITSEAQIKELHPEITGVIFPRKKKPRWCWAVFRSEERANEAFKDLAKNRDVFVSRPNPYERVCKKLNERMKTVLRKKEAKRKLQKMWT